MVFCRRSSISGDFRNKQKYWPVIQSIAAGEVKVVDGKHIPLPIIKRGLGINITSYHLYMDSVANMSLILPNV
jgi:hypothetical protein